MSWPELPLEAWQATCDTLHAHTQLLGKLTVTLAQPEHQLMHSALRITARGWETPPLRAPNGTVIVVALDLREHVALVECGDGSRERIPLTPNRSVAEITRDVLDNVKRIGGEVTINMKPQETSWTTPLDEDTGHATYDTAQVERYFEAATKAAAVLTAFRAPFIGRATPVNAWWGSFDLAVTLFSGSPATPPAEGFIERNAMNAQQVAVGWWPGDARHAQSAFYGYAFPFPEGTEGADVSPGRWDSSLGEFLLDWDDVRAADDPSEPVLTFFRAVAHAGMRLGGWPTELAASLDGQPPPLT
jgi:uncharacterized protein DUF5996